MGDVIYIKDWKIGKLNKIIKLAQEEIKNRDLPPLKDRIKGYAVSSHFISRLLLQMHPITRKQKKDGRSLWGNVLKEHVFTSMEHARKDGFTDVVYETKAIYGTPEGVKELSGCYSIYGRRPSLK